MRQIGIRRTRRTIQSEKRANNNLICLRSIRYHPFVPLQISVRNIDGMNGGNVQRTTERSEFLMKKHKLCITHHSLGMAAVWCTHVASQRSLRQQMNEARATTIAASEKISTEWPMRRTASLSGIGCCPHVQFVRCCFHYMAIGRSNGDHYPKAHQIAFSQSRTRIQRSK